LDWLHVVALLGAVQGVFLAGALATRRRNRTASRLLAALMLAFSVHLATTVYHGAGLERAFPHFFGAAYPLPFLYGPLVYLYAITAADRDRRLGGRDLLHFAPFVVLVLLSLPVYLSSAEEKLAFYRRLVAGDPPALVAIADPLKYVSGIAYAALTIGFLRRHRERVKESYSTVERVNLRWLVLLGGATAAIWGLAVAFQLLELGGIASVGRGDDVVALAMAVVVYATGYMGLRQPEVFRWETAEHPVPALARAPAPEPVPAPVPEPEPTAAAAAARYERSGLAEWEARKLRDGLTVLMETERPWRNSDLTLADLAERLKTTPHKLSEVLNTQVGQTFYDFVNGYRVREVQRRIEAGDAARLTILSLALDAGFASKSAFNVVFKKHTGRTPSDFREAVGT
jgi:AraC-like DNA-binding protein